MSETVETEGEAPQTECRACEAVYTITIGEDFLVEPPRYCPFCGEYVVAEDDD